MAEEPPNWSDLYGIDLNFRSMTEALEAEAARKIAAKALRDAAARMPAFHDKDAPEWAISSACKWLEAEADRLEASAMTDRPVTETPQPEEDE